MNINAMWALYSSIVPPILINEPKENIVDLLEEQSNKVKERKSMEADSNLRGAEILHITNEIARGS